MLPRSRRPLQAVAGLSPSLRGDEAERADAAPQDLVAHAGQMQGDEQQRANRPP